jgi:hypothetical protein
VYVTVPLPVPLAPLVIVSHEDDSVAVHEQPAVVVTVTVAVPPPAASHDGVNGDTVYVHGAVNENVSGAALPLRPPGPTARTDAV